MKNWGLGASSKLVWHNVGGVAVSAVICMGMCWCSGSVDYAEWRLRTALGDWQARSITHTALRQSEAQNVGWLLGQDP